jgi:hypothetical protein
VSRQSCSDSTNQSRATLTGVTVTGLANLNPLVSILDHKMCKTSFISFFEILNPNLLDVSTVVYAHDFGYFPTLAHIKDAPEVSCGRCVYELYKLRNGYPCIWDSSHITGSSVTDLM